MVALPPGAARADYPMGGGGPLPDGESRPAPLPPPDRPCWRGIPLRHRLQHRGTNDLRRDGSQEPGSWPGSALAGWTGAVKGGRMSRREPQSRDGYPRRCILIKSHRPDGVLCPMADRGYRAGNSCKNSATRAGRHQRTQVRRRQWQSKSLCTANPGEGVAIRRKSFFLARACHSWTRTFERTPQLSRNS